MTGEAIRLDKLFVHLISFIFKTNRTYNFEKIFNFTEILTVQNEFSNREVLELVKANKGRDTLGIVLALDRNIREKIKLFNRKISK